LKGEADVEGKIIRRAFWVVVAILWVIIALRIGWLYRYGKPAARTAARTAAK
jgi:uncharacterized membrane protein YhaH (DUF805 family)